MVATSLTRRRHISTLAKKMKTLTSFALILILCSSALRASSPILLSEESLQEWVSEIGFDFTPLKWIPSYGQGANTKDGTLYSTIKFSCVSLTEKERKEFYSNLRAAYTNKGYRETGDGRSRVDEKEIIRKFFFEDDKHRVFLVFVYTGSREGTELITGPRKSLDDFVVVQTIETK
jgi:hypothetical protein